MAATASGTRAPIPPRSRDAVRSGFALLPPPVRAGPFPPLMRKTFVKAAWTLAAADGSLFDPRLFRLLQSIQENGKLTEAARTIGLSYRHAWELLGRWGEDLGAPLVEMARGKGAKLTPLGEKVVWALRRMEATLLPQFENIVSEINAEIAKARSTPPPLVRIHASHCYAVEALAELVRRHSDISIDLRYMGSAEALASLARGECDFAGFHLPLGTLGPVVWSQYAASLVLRQQKIVRLATRRQGLMVPAGNPLGLRNVRDLAKRGVTFVNRQPGSGTRLLLDALLRVSGIEPSRIRGYDSAEFTHAAVAAFVASGAASAGFGVELAARQFRLDFVPVATERYLLSCAGRATAQPHLRQFLALMASATFAKTLEGLPGYAPDQPGTVVALADFAP